MAEQKEKEIDAGPGLTESVEMYRDILARYSAKMKKMNEPLRASQ
jgi:hypothetical protein